MHIMPENSSRRTISQLADLSQYEKTIYCYIAVANDETRVVAIIADRNENYKLPLLLQMWALPSLDLKFGSKNINTICGENGELRCQFNAAVILLCASSRLSLVI